MLRKISKMGFSTSILKFVQDTTPYIEISKLSQGPMLLTEQSSFPTYSDIGICFKTGYRDERKNERGSLFNLKQYLYHTTEFDALDNYEAILKTGCILENNLDQELTYFKCSFLQEDLEYALDTLLKLALTTKTISEQHRKSFQEEQLNQENQEQPTPFDEFIVNSAFAGQLMGNCQSDGLKQLPSNVDFLNFQKLQFTTQNMVLGYAGVQSHLEIKSLFEAKLLKFEEFTKRKLRTQMQSRFMPGTYKQETDSELVNIAIIFQGKCWRDEDMAITQILNSILGNSASWSTGGPGKGMRSRTTLNMMNKIQYVESAGGVNNHYTDNGIFGLKASGYFKNANDLLENMIQELKNLLSPISDEEFKRGKNIWQSMIQLNLERQADRMEEQVKNLFTFGKLTVPQYYQKIEQVTKQEVQQYVFNILHESRPVIVYQGKNIDMLPDMDTVLRMIRKGGKMSNLNVQ